MHRRTDILFIILATVSVCLLVADIATGPVHIDISDIACALTGGDCPPEVSRIIIDIRLVKALTAIIAGAALSVSGLQMQTLFRNPLAGPYILGISSGASLGVALFILGAPLSGIAGIMTSVGIAGAAWIGAGAILAVIAAVSRRIKDIMVILILGIMFSSAVSAIVQILQYLGNEQSLKAYVVWTMGSLGDVTGAELSIMTVAVISGTVISVAGIKPLNTLIFGEEYARTMGINILRTRMLLFVSTTLLAGTVTAFCGPIGFIGLAVPHVTRVMFATADHRILLPASILTGSSTMLLCDIVSKSLTLPVNSITALLGIPIVVWIVLRNRSIAV